MPSSMSTALADSFDLSSTKPAILAKLTLTDSTVIGLTSYQEPITFDGLTYQPDEGIKISVISSSLGADVDNGTATGGSTSRVDEDLLNTDLFDGAKLDIMLMNLRVPSEGVRILHSGALGDLDLEDGQWSVAFRGWSSRLKLVMGELSSKTCTCQRLGDKCCKLNLGGTVRGRNIKANRTVSTIVGTKKFKVSSESAPNDFYTFGYVKFTSGANSGRTFEVKEHKLESSSIGVIELRLAPKVIVVGDTVELTAGCNRKLKYVDSGEPRLGSTCEEFGNQVNHRGQFYLPGNDQITRVGSSQ